MDGGDSCVLTDIADAGRRDHGPDVDRERHAREGKQLGNHGADAHGNDDLERGRGVHTGVALMLDLILHQQAVVLVCCCIKQAMLFNQSFSKRSAYQASKDETEGSCGCTDGCGALYVQVL